MRMNSATRSACRRSQIRPVASMRILIPVATDKSGAVGDRRYSQQSRQHPLAALAIGLSQRCWSACGPLSDTAKFVDSADLGGEFADDVADVLGQLRVLGGRLALQRRKRHRELDRV